MQTATNVTKLTTFNEENLTTFNSITKTDVVNILTKRGYTVVRDAENETERDIKEKLAYIDSKCEAKVAKPECMRYDEFDPFCRKRASHDWTVQKMPTMPVSHMQMIYSCVCVRASACVRITDVRRRACMIYDEFKPFCRKQASHNWTLRKMPTLPFSHVPMTYIRVCPDWTGWDTTEYIYVSVCVLMSECGSCTCAYMQ